MKSLHFLISLFVLFFFTLFSAVAQDREWVPEDTEFYTPVPPVVEAVGGFMEPPSDAFVLFDGTDFSNWLPTRTPQVEWTIEDGAMTVTPRTGNIFTRDSFGSIQLYLEWRTPEVIDGDGQGRGNSGVFLQRRYEVQVLDSYQNETYVNGMAASVYKQYVPLANAARPPGEWQNYNIIFEAPEFDETGELVTPAYITVFWNGVLVQNRVEVEGPTRYIGLPEYVAHGEDGIMLQDHGDLVSFRNIWIRKLDESPVWE
ncbi:MAG: DUF1080 domain-containing protein [Balneolaceae bacterium]|nr:MAG: DUF1080 domain-containing protein [Balneolaceae bacterium]